MTDDSRLSLLETATDTAVMLQELEWRHSGLNDESLAPEFQGMYARLRALNERSLAKHHVSQGHTETRTTQMPSSATDQVTTPQRRATSQRQRDATTLPHEKPSS